MDLQSLNSEFKALSFEYNAIHDNDLLPRVYVIGSMLSRVMLIYYAKDMGINYNAEETNDSGANLSLVYILESPGFAGRFGSCGEAERVHVVGVLTISDEFRAMPRAA